MRKWSKAPRILSLLAVMIAAAVGFAPAAYAEMGDVRIDGAETPAAQTKAVAAVAKPDGTVEFSTLAEAIENADGATVRLLADVTESVVITKGKTITLDLGTADIKLDAFGASGRRSVCTTGTRSSFS